MNRALLVLWPLLILLLTACNAPNITINVQNAAPTATRAIATTAAFQRANVPPDVVALPSGPTLTPMPPLPARTRAAAPTATAHTVTHYRPAALGQAIGAWGWSFRCSGAESSRDGLAWSAAGNRLHPSDMWVVATLDLTNTQTTPQAASADEFVIRDVQQRSFAPTTALGGAEYSTFRGGQRFGEPVPPDATVRYYLAFDVPTDAQQLHLVLASRPAANGFEVLFDLGR